MIKVAIAGATGYTAGELLRILLRHPQVQVESLLSISSVGVAASQVHRDLIGETDLIFTDKLGAVDVVFLCLGHGLSRQFLADYQLPSKCKIIDLGNDFRLDRHFAERDFIYGLTEFNRSQIQRANSIANPGCFATAILLASFPLAKLFGLVDDIHVHGVTGTTGAGKSPSAPTHFSYRSANISVYKPFVHQHLAEINNTLLTVANMSSRQINFVPMRGDFARGIFVSMTTRLAKNLDLAEITKAYDDFYSSSAFVHLSAADVSLKEVINTNKALLHLAEYQGYLHVTCVIDNLLKGASGQAVQNMNLLFGLAETTGLALKASVF